MVPQAGWNTVKKTISDGVLVQKCSCANDVVVFLVSIANDQ